MADDRVEAEVRRGVIEHLAEFDGLMIQVAAYPEELVRAMADHRSHPNWSMHLWTGDRGRPDEPLSYGLTFEIQVTGKNAYHPDDPGMFGVRHLFIVPAATYDYANWRRWIVDRCLEVHQHEFCEWFRDLHDDARPYAPRHGPGQDPYFLVEYGTEEERRTNNRGVVKDG